MTKTLTEQWRNEELPIDLYYVIDKLGRETIGNDCEIRDMMVDAFNGGNIFIKEVLAPVPSYKTWKAFQQHFVDKTELEVKLKNAYEQLEQQSIKVVELQEQLKEANAVIKFYNNKDFHYQAEDGVVMGKEPAHKYLLKWGVK